MLEAMLVLAAAAGGFENAGVVETKMAAHTQAENGGMAAGNGSWNDVETTPTGEDGACPLLC